MAHYFNIIEAMFKSVQQVKDRLLIGLSATGIVGSFLIIFLLTRWNFVIGLVLGILLAALLDWYLSFRIHQRVMEKLGIGLAPSLSFRDWAWLHFRRFFIDLFCWYDKKLLIPVVLVIVLALAAVMASGGGSSSYGASGGGLAGFMAMGGIIAAIAPLVLLVWGIVFIVHSTRTKFATWLYLTGTCPQGEAIRASNAHIKGQTLEAVLPSHINYGILTTVFQLIFYPLYVMAIVLIVILGIATANGLLMMALIALFALVFVALLATAYAQTVIIEAGLFVFWTGEEPVGTIAPGQPAAPMPGQLAPAY